MSREEIEQKKAELKRRKETTCKHFTGCTHEKCEAADAYRVNKLNFKEAQ